MVEIPRFSLRFRKLLTQTFKIFFALQTYLLFEKQPFANTDDIISRQFVSHSHLFLTIIKSVDVYDEAQNNIKLHR